MRTTVHTPHHVSDIEINISFNQEQSAPGASYNHNSEDVPVLGATLTPQIAKYLIHEMAFEFLDRNCEETSPNMETNVDQLVIAVTELFTNSKRS